MIDISVHDIKKAFEEGNDILSGLSFDVNEGERVGLLGNNGAGKTTLLRLITGELTPDEGAIAVPGYKKIGLISQIPSFPPGFTVGNVLRMAFEKLESIESEMETLHKLMAESDDPAVLRAYDDLAFEFDRLGGYDTGFELNRVVNGLRIPNQQMEQSFQSLSGGEKTRVNLARLILEKTDILLLDEPTNHLDIKAVEWLEEFLGRFKGTALVISHDRYFLDRTINRAIEINKGVAEFYSGNYSFYVLEKRRRLEEQLEKYNREQVEAKRLHESADRLKQWGTGNKYLMRKSFAVRRRAERAVTIDKPVKDRAIGAKFSEREFRGDELMTVRNLEKSFGGRKIIDIGELEVLRGERIAIIGDNGAGKSTLAKTIVGELKPDTGSVKRGPSVRLAYLPQIVGFDYPRRSLLDTLVHELDVSPQTARNKLGAFMFTGEDVFKAVGDLSGGEKSRLRLCMLMNDDVNLLILDEPTNHLDLQSREWIEEAIGKYGETLVFISHDRFFINRFATRIWELEDGRLTDFIGTYTDYRNSKAEKTTSEASKKEPATRVKPKRKTADAQKELRRLEREIDSVEKGLAEVRRKKEEYSSDYEKLMDLDGEELEVQESLNRLYDEWGVVAESCPETD